MTIPHIPQGKGYKSYFCTNIKTKIRPYDEVFKTRNKPELWRHGRLAEESY